MIDIFFDLASLLISFFLIFLIASCSTDNNLIEYINGALAPEEAVETFELPPGFKIELFASEPLISDPVDMTIDEYGNTYIVEMHGYPLDKSGKGSIKLLRDTDGDGRMDESIVFADGLVWPFGIMRWKDGVVVADAPYIIYLEDEDGDGVADIRDTILTGFAFSNPQMNVGGPIYGLDNWIYLTSEAGGSYQLYKDLFGSLGTDIYYPGFPDRDRIPAQGSGRTIRFRPDSYEIEQTSGVTQFSRAYDEWGRHILCNNSNHIYHEVIAAPYLNRNNDLLVPGATNTLSDHGSKVYAITDRPERQLLSGEGVFTSATGITAYKGGAFPAPYDRGVTFVAEPVSNIVHADRLEDQGASFIAKKIGAPQKEFLASTDFWFRPVNMYVGPDGALYVVDYYRQIIEHPEWMSEEVVQSGELYNGIDMGRIYRITYEGAEDTEWTQDLSFGDESSEEMVKYLSHSNSWWRMNAQRILVDRGDVSIYSLLMELLSESEEPFGRLHALWTMEGLGLVDQSVLEKGLRDEIAGVRENTIKIAEAYLADYPDLISELIKLKDDKDEKVRYQLLCTLGYDSSEKSKKVRNELLKKDISDPWIQIAALSAESFRASEVFEDLIEDAAKGGSDYNSLVYRLSELLITGGEEDFTNRILRQIIHDLQIKNERGWEVSAMAGMSSGLRQDKTMSDQVGWAKSELVNIFLEDIRADVRKASLSMLQAIGVVGILEQEKGIESKIISMVGDRNLSGERRAELVEFMRASGSDKYFSFFQELVYPEEDIAVQISVLHSMNDADGLGTSRFILSNWDRLSPQIRNTAIQLQLSSREQVKLFLDAIEEGTVQKSAVDFTQRVRFMTYPGDDIKKRARVIFGKKEEGEISEEYKTSLEMNGDAERGKRVFQENCAQCHQMNGELGTEIGPDLNTVSSWNPEGILSQILFPSSSIAVGYELWEIELADESRIQGVIVSETPTAITVRNLGMEDRIVGRSAIKSLKSLEHSLMPGGWDEIIEAPEMADLMAFIRNQE